MITQMIQIILQQISRQIVINVIQQQPGHRQPGITIINISRFILDVTRVNGIHAQIVIRIQVITHHIPVTLFVIKAITIKMKIVILVIQEVTDEKE
jgi:hypothetical protein